jgi:hypothetical protein
MYPVQKCSLVLSGLFCLCAHAGGCGEGGLSPAPNDESTETASTSYVPLTSASEERTFDGTRSADNAASANPDWLAAELQHHMGEGEASLLSQAKKQFSAATGESVDFNNQAIRLRTLEELLVIKNQGLDQAPDHGFIFDRATTLATDWAYVTIAVPQANLQEAQKQYQGLVDIAKRMLSDHLDRVNASPEEKGNAFNEFQKVVQLGLSYFETPRVAALADTLTAEQIASVKMDLRDMVSVSFEDRARQLHEYETKPAPPGMGKRLHDQRISNGRQIRLQMAASFAASIPFQLYLLESAPLDDPDHPASLIAPLGHVSVGKISHQERDLFAISYFFEDGE